MDAPPIVDNRDRQQQQQVVSDADSAAHDDSDEQPEQEEEGEQQRPHDDEPPRPPVPSDGTNSSNDDGTSSRGKDDFVASAQPEEEQAFEDHRDQHHPHPHEELPPLHPPEPYGANLVEYPPQHVAATQQHPIYLVQQQQQQQQPAPQVLALPPPPPALESHPALAMAHYYESRMRDHAAAYANAAAGAAWAAAQIAAAAANFAANPAAGPPPSLQPPPHPLPPHPYPAAATGNPILVYGPPPQEDPSTPYFASPMVSVATTPPNAWVHPSLSTPGSTFAVYGGHAAPVQPSQPSFYPPAEEATGYRPPPPPGVPTFASPQPFAQSGGRLERRGRNSRRRSNSNHNQYQQHQLQQQQLYQVSSGRQKKRQQHFHSDGDSSSVSVPRRVTVSSARMAREDSTRRRTRPSNDDDRGTDADSKYWSDDGSNTFHESTSPPATQKAAPRSESTAAEPAPPADGPDTLVDSTTTKQDPPKVRERNRRREDDDLSSSTTTTTATVKAASRPRSKKKLRGDGDDAVLLLGRTGVAALYEWCSKRFKVPSIRLEKEGDEFLCIVELDGVELGRGMGRNKASAKQVAARRAIQAVVPGVRFDPVTCIVTDVVATTSKSEVTSTGDPTIRAPAEADVTAVSSLDDLAPNLAKRLAIGRDDEDVQPSEAKNVAFDVSGSVRSLHLSSHSSTHKRLLNVYPGTSTTSEEDDESASRDASVCSALLHTMVQIDGRIREPPDFQFELKPHLSTATASNSISCGSAPEQGVHTVGERTTLPVYRTAQLTKDSVASAIQPSIRGFFSCTATLRLYDQPVSRTTTSASDEENDERKPPAYQVLSASGSGSTKKESRHMAAAQLLALLFPDCSNLLEVKAAAEAAREAYAVSRTTNKALLGSSRGSGARERQRQRQRRSVRRTSRTRRSILSFVTSLSANELALPEPLRSDMEKLLGVPTEGGACPDPSEGEDCGSIALRVMSRQRQLDSKVEMALQTLNELDDEGRSLPSELTENDIGRTVLRRAVPGDWSRMKRLLNFPVSSRSAKTSTASTSSSLATQLWSSSCIVLLLCRAIAAYEDPPLGCAILTLGFSMDSGPLLSVVQLGSEHHLPKERFVECLQGFARAMKCTLRVADGSHHSTSVRSGDVLSEPHLRMILSRRLQPEIGRTQLQKYHPSSLNQDEEGDDDDDDDDDDEDDVDDDDDDDACPIKRMSSPLQSVLEEESEAASDSSSVEKRPQPTKRSTKPSKRSRFA